MKFERIKAEGFGSIVAPINFELNRPGINILNSKNGVGKTTLFSAIYWALFGQTLRKGGKGHVSWEEVRTKDWRGTRVILFFTLNEKLYAVVRHAKYKAMTNGSVGGDSLRIYENGVEVGAERGKDNVQGYIESLIGYTADSFLYGVIFGQKMKRFIEAENSDKREFLEGLFDLRWLADIQNRVTGAIANRQSIHSDLLQTKARYEGEAINVANTLTTLLATQQAAIDNYNLFMQYYPDHKAKNLAELTKLEPRVVKAETDLAEALAVIQAGEDGELATLTTDLAIRQQNKSTSIRLMETEKISLQAYEAKLAAVSTTCPTCSQELADKKAITKTKEVLAKSIKDSIRVIDGFTNDLVTLDKEIGELMEKISVLRQKNAENQQKNAETLRIISEERDYCRAAIYQLNGELQQLESDKVKLATEAESTRAITQLETRRAELATQLDTVNKSLESSAKLINNLNWWATKAFSASGIKAYMFESLVSELNEKVVKYAQRFGLGIFFGVDLSKKSKPFLTKVSINGMEDKDYNELSGGQQQRVNICMAFALYDLLSERVNPVNIFVLDEVFEGLDDEGTEAVFEFIQDQARVGKSVYVVIHLQAHNTAMARTINVDNSNRTTVYELS